VNRLARLTLLAYPRSFRRDFGVDYVQAATDLDTHGQHSRLRVAGRLAGDVLTTATAMRWEQLVKPGKLIVAVVVAVAAAFGLLLGAPSVALPLLAILAALVISARRHDQPIATQATAWSQRWYLWLAVAAAMFALGLTALAVDGDDELSAPVWAIWVLSWLAAAVIATVGLGLGATRLVNHRRT